MGCTESRPNTKPDSFVINGFYMSMREKFVAAGTSIHYYTVEWDEKDLSWEDFRGTILGATNPSEAKEGSLRNTILADYEALGLSSKPNTGDNGVHASASPFEGLAERMNWCGAKLSEDAFGKAMLAAGVEEKTITEWTQDPQVMDGETKTSLFDAVEDMNASAVLTKSRAIAKVESKDELPAVKNMAFVFIKPHANNKKVQDLVKAKFEEAKITIVSEAEVTGETIDEKKYIDVHYGSIAKKAMETTPKDLNVPEKGLKEFEKKFGLTWAAALEAGSVYNAAEASAKFTVSAGDLDNICFAAKKAGNVIKFGGGFYCAGVSKPAPETEKKEEKTEKVSEKEAESKEEVAPLTDKAEAKDDAAQIGEKEEEQKAEAN
jgi:hypothetical protein